MREAKGNSALYRRLQMVHLRVARGMTQEAIAKATGVSRSTVNRAPMAWFESGLEGLGLKPRGGRQRENLPPVEKPCPSRKAW
ncbi:MAG: helix-turn-helix domain-containing protein [Pseudomonadota bacterium]